jgi:hypothetical protein
VVPVTGPDTGQEPGDAGAVAVLVSVLAVVLFVVSALVVDLGLARDTRGRAQNAADSSALAAALTLAGGGSLAEATATAHRYAATNYQVTPAEWAGCTDQAPLAERVEPCVSADPATRTVRVMIPERVVPAFFAGIIGGEGIGVRALAEAGWGPRAADCVLCVLDDVQGQVGSLTVDGGSVAVNGDLLFNNANGRIAVTGGVIGYSGTWNGNGDLTPQPVRQPPVPDPFAAVPLPPAGTDLGAPATEPAADGPCVPGNYTTVARCTSFSPGVYVIAGGRPTTIHGAVRATDVLLYFTCSRQAGGTTYPEPCAAGGQEGASLDGAGSGTAEISGRTSGGYPEYLGLAMVFDRNNTATQRWVGNGDLVVHGASYLANPGALLDLRGNGSFTAHGVTVVGDVLMRGQGRDQLHFSVNAPDLPVPAGPPQVHLLR